MATFFQLIRIKHWIKNLFVFAPIIFSMYLFDADKLLKSTLAFFALSLISSFSYIINDINDKESDSLHSIKKKRPIAAGKVSKIKALIIGIILACMGFVISFILGKYSIIILIVFFLLHLIYTFFLKKYVLIDVFTIAIGFCLRVLLGSIVIGVGLSHWMLLTTFSISLIFGFGKRRHELELLGSNASNHRINLSHYNKLFLDSLIIICTSLTAISYTLYTIDPGIINKFGTAGLIFTVPFVLYGIFRYLFLIYLKDRGGSPEELVLTDPGIILSIILWLIVILIQIYFKDYINFDFNIII